MVKFYALGGRRLTNEEYLEIIRNCPKARYSYEKGSRQIKTGNILVITGVGLGVTLTLTGLIASGYLKGGGLAIGAPVALASIPFYIAGSKKKNNAYQVYNQYCSQPPADSLSYGPATKGLGMGVYLNF